MKEHNRNLRTAAGFLVLLLVSAVLVSCDDLTVMLDQIDDEVKLANDRYLEVESVYPDQNSWFVNPGQDIQITFDRPVAVETALRSIDITDSQGNLFSLTADDAEFDSATNTLTLMPKPYLEDSRQYTIILSPKLTSLTANPLREEYSWSFTTGTYPKGYFVIHDTITGTGLNAGYTKSTQVPIEVFYSNAVDFFIDDTAPTASSNSEKSGLVWTPLSGNIQDLGTLTGDGSLSGKNGLVWDLGSSPQGLRTIYMLFRDGAAATSNYTPVEIDRTYLDTVAPTVDAGVNAGPVRTEFTRTALSADTGSGIDKTSYDWDADAGMSITSGEFSRTATFGGVASGEDDTYTLTMTVADKAGNTGSGSFDLDWDTDAPNPPAFSTLPTDPSTVDDLTWSWTRSSSLDDVLPYHYRLYYQTTSWSTTTSTSRLAKNLSDGRHRFDIGQYDDAGNFAYTYDYVVVNTAQISPYDNEIGVSTKAPLELAWQPRPIATYTYALFRGDPDDLFKDILLASGSAGSSNSVTPAVTLQAGTNYFWGYSVRDFRGITTEYGPYEFNTR